MAAQARARGAAGVLPRAAEPGQLEAAVRAVRAGLVVTTPELAAGVSPVELPDPDPLTPREREVLELLAEGWSNRELARALDISHHTVKFHVDRLLLRDANHGDVVAQKLVVPGM